MSVTNSKVARYLNLGMNRDTAPEKGSDKFAYDNHNIRITEMENSSFLSVTNEKGTEPAKVDGTQIIIDGKIVGQAVLGIYIILFVYVDSETNKIIRITYSPEEEKFTEVKELYSGNLGFSGKKDIETLSSYETEKIQKVYWTDGINQPRIINIVDEDSVYTDKSFDFTLELTPGTTIIKAGVSENNSGEFPSGVLQYCFTYSKDNGQETPVIASSSLLFLSHRNMGIREDGVFTKSIKVDISTIDKEFDHINVYAIHRVSLDSLPTVRSVASLNIKEDNNYSVVDTGKFGATMDYMELLYKGGTVFSAKTLEQKDNTLFLGNITLFNNQEEFETIKAAFHPDEGNVSITTTLKTISGLANSSVNSGYFYPFSDKEEEMLYYRGGNYYRFAVQFKDKYGFWSDPVWVGDVQQTNLKPNLKPDGKTFEVPIFQFTISSEAFTLLNNSTYVGWRVLVKYPDEIDRVIAAQGVVCPTVFNPKDRNSDVSYAEPYWSYYVPREYSNYQYLAGNNNLLGEIQSQYNTSGKFSLTGSNNCMFACSNLKPYYEGDPTPEFAKENEVYDLVIGNKTENSQNSDYYALDFNTVTFNSPDIEDINNTQNFNINVCGYAELNKQRKNIICTLNSTGWGQDSEFSSVNLPCANRKSYTPYYDATSETSALYVNYTSYPWHRSTSANNDFYREGEKLRAEIKNKIYATYTYFKPTTFTSLANGISIHNVSVFDPTLDISSLNLDQKLLSSGIYRGNLNTLVMPFKGVYPIYNGYYDASNPSIKDISRNKYEPTIKYTTLSEQMLPLYVDSEGDLFGSPTDNLGFSNQGVQIKFKSEKHAVFNFPCEIVYFGWYGQKCLPNYKTTHEGGQYELDVLLGRMNWLSNDTMYHKEIFSDPEPTKDKLYIVDLIQPIDEDALFGGKTEDAIKNTLWIPASKELDVSVPVITLDRSGDTRYQRWDSLKVYPYSDSDKNSVIEVGSFFIETYRNLNGRYDKHIGTNNYLYVNPNNFNLYNDVWNQKNNFFNYRIVEMEKKASRKFPNQFAWSLEKSYGADIDNWTNITLASIYNTEGSLGEITSLITYNDQLLCFQEKAVSQILFNSRVQINVSDGLPVELSNSGKVDGVRYLTTFSGCSNNNSIVQAQSGLYFVDNLNADIMKFSSQGITSLSKEKGMEKWVKDTLKNNKEVNSYYDSYYNDVYFDFAGSDTLVYSEKLDQFMSFVNYENVGAMIPIYNRFVAFNNTSLNKTAAWYVHEGPYCTFFGKSYPYYIEYRIGVEPSLDKTFTNIEYIAPVKDVRTGDDVLETFDSIRCKTDYQDTGIYPLVLHGKEKYYPNDVSVRNRIWRINIPRQLNSMNRIRGPWMKLRLTKSVENERDRYLLMQFDNLLVRYIN